MMKLKNIKIIKKEEGQSLVEFALLLPMLILILMIPVDIYQYMENQISLNNALSSAVEEIAFFDNTLSDSDWEEYFEKQIALKNPEYEEIEIEEYDDDDDSVKVINGTADLKVKVLNSKVLDPIEYKDYVYNSDKDKVDNYQDYQEMFEPRQSNYQTAVLTVQASCRFRPLSPFGFFFVNDDGYITVMS